AFSASEVLPLGPREFSELDNHPTYKNVSIVKTARLQSNTFASNKSCNCRGNCLMAKCFCKKANVLCRSRCHSKNSKCKNRA
ncbi:10288_t:CDS:1, partial [Dentiscutata heterogama]